MSQIQELTVTMRRCGQNQVGETVKGPERIIYCNIAILGDREAVCPKTQKVCIWSGRAEVRNG